MVIRKYARRSFAVRLVFFFGFSWVRTKNERIVQEEGIIAAAEELKLSVSVGDKSNTLPSNSVHITRWAMLAVGTVRYLKN